MVTTNVQVLGMTCEHCERAVIAEVGRLPSVVQVTVELHPGEASTVRIDSPEPLDPAALAAAIDEAGYRLADA